MSKFLVVDDEPADVALMEGVIRRMGHEVATAKDAGEAMELVRDEPPDAVFLDILLPDENGLELFNQIRHLNPKMPIIFVTASGSSNVAIEAMQRGALDYLTKPLQVPKVRRAVERAVDVIRASRHPVAIAPPITTDLDRDVIIGRSPAMQEVYKAIGLVAARDVSVLIRGESGTGKELVAKAIYQFSKRSSGPFLAVNCAAIPESLLESELFGHEKGAFTGADKRHLGKFEQCNRGTLFLDEIGDMPLMLQSKILRVLQDGTFQRVGGNETIRTDVRIIAATHRNLEAMVESGDFREDLFYRLNEFTISLPPLRERGDDIELLIDFFRRQANSELDKQVQGVSPEAMELLRAYHWPGNVRELQNVIRQAVLKTSGPLILPEYLPGYIIERLVIVRKTSDDLGKTEGAAAPKTPPKPIEQLIEEKLHRSSNHLYDEVISEVEEKLVMKTLAACGGDKAAAIRRLGVNPLAMRSVAAIHLLDLNAATRQPSPPPPTTTTGQRCDDAEVSVQAALGEHDTQETQAAAHQADSNWSYTSSAEHRSGGDQPPEMERQVALENEWSAASKASDSGGPRHRPCDEQEPVEPAVEVDTDSATVVRIRPGMTMEEIEREAIRQALQHTGGKRTAAAQMLGISVRTLQRKLKQYDLDL